MKREIAETLTADQQAELKALAALPDDRIDTSEIPEVPDWSDARRGLFYRPVKQQITSKAISRWCDARREAHAAVDAVPWIEIGDPCRLRETERDAIASHCARFNLALYRFARSGSEPDALSAFAGAIGLVRRDLTLGADHRGVASVRVARHTRGSEMIPFTSRALNWHTDGYYNAPEQSVRSVVMHCASPAASGGETTLLDPDLVYAAMHARDPALVEALVHPCAMTIPAYEADGAVARPARTGPVFRFLDDPPKLHMRYTMRTRSIQWRSTQDTTRAVIALEEAIASLAPHHVRVRFETGEGVICNNVLHRRSVFVDGEDEGSRRVMLRIRSFDPVSSG